MVVIEIHSQDEFTAKLQEAGDKPVAIDFSATWCKPCQSIKPHFAALSEQFTDMIFCSVDVDEVDGIAQSNGVTALPTFIFFKHGKEVKKLTGARESELDNIVKMYSSPKGAIS